MKIWTNFESVVWAGFDVQINALSVLIDLPWHLDGPARIMLLEVLYLEEVDTLEVVNLPPGHSHSVRGNLPILVHHLHIEK